MDLAEFHNLQPGDTVTTKNGKTYRVTKRRRTLADYIKGEIAYIAHNLAFAEAHPDRIHASFLEDNRKKDAKLAEVAQRGYDLIWFEQIRANSKGVVGPYGPSTTLKPENLTRA